MEHRLCVGKLQFHQTHPELNELFQVFFLCRFCSLLSEIST